MKNDYLFYRNKGILEKIKRDLNYIILLENDLLILNEILKLSCKTKTFKIWRQIDSHSDIEIAIDEQQNRIHAHKKQIKENLLNLKYDDTYLITERPSYRESSIKTVNYHLDVDKNYFTVRHEFDDIRGTSTYYIDDEIVNF